MTTGHYRAQGCWPSSSNELETGVLIITEDGAAFQGKSGNFTLPLAGLKINRAGATGDTIQLTHPACTGCFISTTDLSLLTDRILISRADLKSGLKTGKRKGICCLGGCLAAILLVVLAIFGLVLLRDSLVAGLAQHFPQETEQKLGDLLLPATLPESSRISDKALVEGIEAIARPIFNAIPADEGFSTFTLHLSSNAEANAFAIPGGHIIVNAGLIALADTPEEVAGVLAHETAHATLRHSLQSIINRLGTMAAINLILGDVEGLTGVLVDGGDFLLSQKYSRDFERQADEKAWEYLQNARVNPAGLVSFFEKLEKEYGTAVQPAILSTHPATADRISNLKSRLNSLPDPPPDQWHKFDLDYNAYKAAVKLKTSLP